MPRKKLTIKDMQQIAAEHSGKCLSIEYINTKDLLKWECRNGHVWMATPSNIIYSKTWCPKCDPIKKLSIKEMQEIAAMREGKCLSSEYINIRTALKWECKYGHQWTALPDQIKRGSWCPKCQKLTLEEMQKIAVSRGGKCLSSEYINAQTGLEWECKYGHQWKTTPNSIKRGSWCPICFNQKQKFIIYKKYDIEKMQNIAKEYGGKCLSTGYVNINTPLEWECADGHTWWAAPGNILYKFKTWCPVCACKKKLTLEEMQQLATNHGGKCLSTEYINGKTKLEWECSNGHKWLAAPSNIKIGQWCPVCANRIKHTLDDAKVLAMSHHGKCLSKEYINGLTALKWECEHGHKWQSRLDSVIQGRWCSICANEAKKLTIEEMRQLAAEHGGKCLSTEYVNVHTKLEWECSNGHKWLAAPKNIKIGRWCPTCSIDKRRKH
jgi:hypothetical protein